MSAKRLELIREVVPTAKTIAVSFNPNNPGSRPILEDVRGQAAKLGMIIQPIEFMGSAVLDATLETAAGHDALTEAADASAEIERALCMSPNPVIALPSRRDADLC